MKNAQYLEQPSTKEIDTLASIFNCGQYTEAVTLAQAITERYPLHGFGWKVLGAAFKQLGRSAEALVPMQKSAALSPNDADAHNNLGVALKEMDRLDEAESSYRRALEIEPDCAEAHSNLGNILRDTGRLDDAEDSCRRALAIKPNFAVAHLNLGNTLHNLGRLEEAEISYRRALTIKPNLANAYNNLGVTLKDLGRLEEAEISYRRALEIKPDYTDALNNLASLFNVPGKLTQALGFINQSLQIRETAEAKAIFTACIKRLRLTHDDEMIRLAMVRALTEPWGRPKDLARIGIDLVKLDSGIKELMARASDAWPLRLPAQDLFGANGLTTLAENQLLRALLNSAPICDIGMERFLTMARRAMLEAATMMTASDDKAGAALGFFSALAYQCFINEYVFCHTDDEIRKASDLRDTLVAVLTTDTHAQVPILWLLAVAAYFPLHTLPPASRLLENQWPDAVTAVITQQIREPREEMQLRATIPCLTNINDKVSLLVQNQYEENPYPRWVKIAPASKAENITSYLSEKFPLSPINRHNQHGNIQVLIAGCGTGQHSISTAQMFKGAQVLAIDLSMSSLGYAKRMTRKLGLTSIEYAQADLLKLGSTGRCFDVIESVGVLHHLADPWTGWQVLISLLRPGGFMRLGFYSEVARRTIVRIRDFIAARGYGSTTEDIRRCRQELIDLGNSADFGTTLSAPDFFSISTCRDLLFHAQEHRMTLTRIDAFLRENNLVFLGFDDSHIIHAYKRRFPDDNAATNLTQWQVFEDENPDTFHGMYQFWIQKTTNQHQNL